MHHLSPTHKNLRRDSSGVEESLIVSIDTTNHSKSLLVTDKFEMTLKFVVCCRRNAQGTVIVKEIDELLTRRFYTIFGCYHLLM